VGSNPGRAPRQARRGGEINGIRWLRRVLGHDSDGGRGTHEYSGLIHTSQDCGGNPICPLCNDERARVYARLLLDVDGRRFLLDVPPKTKRRFAAMARVGITGPIRLICNCIERKGRAWGDISFEIVKEAA